MKDVCTLMSNEWTDGKSRFKTNFLANRPKGMVFIRSIDTLIIMKNFEKLYELLDKVVKVIGEENVVQMCIGLCGCGQTIGGENGEFVLVPMCRTLYRLNT